MARARNIKPAFFSNDTLAECDPLARLLFAGLWTIADREGRLEDRPKRIKGELLPYDDKADANRLLEQLASRGFILRYAVDGQKCIQIVNFRKHQDPHYKEKASELPAPEGLPASTGTAGAVSEKVRLQVFDRDGRRCKRCGSEDALSVDHIVPRSKGGSHDMDNLQTLCRRCNSGKNNREASSKEATKIGQASANDRPSIEALSVHLPPDKPPLIPSSLIPSSGVHPADSTQDLSTASITPIGSKAPLNGKGHGQPAKPATGQWWRTDQGIDAKARELGLTARPGEGYPELKDRLMKHIHRPAKGTG